MVCPCFGTQGHSSSKDFLITILKCFGYQNFLFLEASINWPNYKICQPANPKFLLDKRNESSSLVNERQEIVDCTHSYYTQFYLLKFVNQQNSQLSSAPLVCLGYQLLKFFLRLFSEMSFCSKVSLLTYILL